MRAKHLTLLVAIFAIITMMFVSCNSEVAENSAISEPGKELVYASFVDKGAKELSFSYDVPAYDTLFWRYSAVKKDSYGTVGQTWAGGTAKEVFAPIPTDASEPTQGLAGKVGPFSQGKWDFKLQAFRSCVLTDNTLVFSDKVFEGTATNVVLNKNQTNYIAVTVTPAGDTGKIKFVDAYYQWYSTQTSGTADVDLRITIVGTPDVGSPIDPEHPIVYTETLYANQSYCIHGDDGYLVINQGTSAATTDIPTGVYTATVEIVDSATQQVLNEFAKQVMSLKVYGGLETIVSGNLTEGLSYENYFSVPEQTIASTTTSASGAASMSVDMTPASTTSATMKTTVEFPENSLSSNTQHTLSVEVTNIETAETQFDITTKTSNEEAAVAAIGLNLTKTTVTTDETTGEVTDTTTEKVQDFNGQYVTIKTYIQSGLTGTVTVMYDGEGEQPRADESKTRGATGCNIAATLSSDSGLGYNPATGYLSFETNHFSEFYVKTNVEALNVSSGRYYPSLASALDAALDGQTIKLLKDTVLDATYTHSNPFLINVENMTLDLNGREITVNENMSFIIQADGAKLINGSIKGTYTSDTKNARYAICVNDCDGAIIENVTVTGGIIIGGDPDGGYTPGAAPATNVIIRNCSVTQSVKADRYAVCAQNTSSVLIESGSFTNPNSSGKVIYGTFAAHDGNPGFITITGGTFVGSISPNDAPEHIMIKGGVFTDDPSALVVEGYVAIPNNPSAGLWTVAPLVTVKHGEKTTGYGDLQSAFDDTQDGDIVTIHGNIDLGTQTSTPLTTKEGVEFTLDLNGHTVSAAIDGNGNRYTYVRVLKNRGEMTLTDLSEGEVVGSISNTAASGNDCTRTVENAEGASLTVNKAQIYSSIGQALINSGEVTLNSGAVIMTEGHRGGDYENGAVAIDLRGTGTISITDGATVYSKEAQAMYVFSGGQVDINGGNFHCNPSMGLFDGDGANDIVVTGGTYNSDPTIFKAWYCSLQYEDPLYTIISANCNFVEVDSVSSLKTALGSATENNPYEITLTNSITISDSVVISNNALLKINSDVTVSVVDGGLLDNRNIIENNGTINVTGTGFLPHPLNIVNSGENAELTGYSDNYYDYDGDSEDDYVITNPMDLQWLAFINSGETYEDLNVYFANDIVFPAGVEFQPIPIFSGVFDGIDGEIVHSIEGIVINSASSYTGIFECLINATIKNLTISENVTALSGTTAGIAGRIYEDTFFENVALYGYVTVEGSSYGLGGFVGSIKGRYSSQNIHFVDCVNNLTISGPHAAFAGGFYGTSSGQLSPLYFINCTNNGNVSAGIYYAGSIGGYSSFKQSGSAIIYNHVNTGALSAPTRTGVMGCDDGYTMIYSKENYDCVAGINGAYTITPKQTN